MAVKTITIDIEAYDILVRARKGNESFSTVIKETLDAESKTAANLLFHADEFLLTNETIDAIESVVKSRNEDLLVAEPINTYGT